MPVERTPVLVNASAIAVAKGIPEVFSSIRKHRLRSVHACIYQAFQALLPEGQPGHRRGPDAAELRAVEAARRAAAGIAVVQCGCQAADLPDIHRGGLGVSEAPGAASA